MKREQLKHDALLQCIVQHIYEYLLSLLQSMPAHYVILNYFSVSVVNYIYCEIATVLNSYMNIFVIFSVIIPTTEHI